MADLKGKSVVLGVTGGIAAYKSCEIVSRFKKLGATVDVIMTRSACQFVQPLTFRTLSQRPVVADTFAESENWEVEHIALAKKADVFLIAPATANILAKMAAGIADDMLSTTWLAVKAPVLVAPAMNTVMFENPVTQENLKTLRSRGVLIIGPEGGLLACGDVGAGRMSEPEDIVAACVKILLRPRDLEGLNVLVTAGPTREKIDPVRFISNHSSGRMGYAIAQAALARGANVTLVSGPVLIPAPLDNVIQVETTEDLLREVTSRAAHQDIIIQAAAPADFRPREMNHSKIKKSGRDAMALELTANPDVAQAVGEMKRPGQVLVGFAAETDDVLENARRKLDAKNLDFIVANDLGQPGAGFEVDTNIVTFLRRGGFEALPLLPKPEVADRILTEALSCMDRGTKQA